MPEKDAKGHLGARAAALISRLRALELPDAAKGLKGEWLAVSCAVCIFVVTAVVCAARGAGEIGPLHHDQRDDHLIHTLAQDR